MKKSNPDKNKNRTRCEIWSRVVGYLRPVSRYNEGKAAEFKDRKMFKTGEITPHTLKVETNPHLPSTSS